MKTAIASIDHELVELQLHEPFAISGGTATTASLALVRVQLADGTVGLGEAAPLTAYNGETIAHAQRALESARPVLLGCDARDVRRCSRLIASAPAASASARCGLEMAVVDALCQSLELPLPSWFGGATEGPLETDVTIPIVSAEAAREAASRWWARGFRALKIKIGGGDDVERVLATHAGAPHARLLLDANGGLTAAGALSLLDAVERHGVTVDLFEQPVARGDWQGLGRVARRCRVALDESVASAADALEASRHLGAPHVVNVKLMKAGIVEALDVVAVARAAGLSLMIGGMLESTLAMSASAAFAIGLGGFEFVDLDTPLFIRDSPFAGGLVFDGASLSLTPGAFGHGVRHAAATPAHP
jgi:L-alanine-DL-glutamate epimerase-like enolase superfamily enzyme